MKMSLINPFMEATFSNFYHEKYKVKDDPEYYSPTCKILLN